jgi:hypothetical protein
MASMSRTAGFAGGIVARLLALLPVIALYYAVLLLIGAGIATGTAGFFAPVDNGLAFNNMLSHLLRGEFDVDAAAIGYEGYARGGRTYAYFGVFPALLRLPFSIFGGLGTTDFTVLSCLLGAIVLAGCMLASILVVWRALPPSRLSTLLGGGLIVTALFSGPQIAFLKPSIYQEVVLWANAMAAAFVCCAVYGIFLRRGFSMALLTGMAVLAGLCLNTRVSTAIGLYAAAVMVVARSAWIDLRHGRHRLPGAWSRLLLPLTVLAVFAAICGVVNYERWGDPLTFVDLNRHLMLQTQFPDVLLAVARHGNFNPARIGYGLVYYLFPVWVIRGPDGGLLFEDFERRFMDSVELPPFSLLISDPLLIGFAALGIALAWRRRRRAGVDVRAIGLASGALALPILLMLMAISMTFRYRGEFYPLLQFLACAGFFFACAAPSGPPPASIRALVLAGCVFSVLATHVSLALYDLSSFGSARHIMAEPSIIDYYRERLNVVTGALSAEPAPR